MSRGRRRPAHTSSRSRRRSSTSFSITNTRRRRCVDSMPTRAAATPPDVLALSNYSWNSKLSERVARLAKERKPNVVTVQGGTNFPHREAQQLEFLCTRPATDVFVELEGETSFLALLRRVLAAR